MISFRRKINALELEEFSECAKVLNVGVVESLRMKRISIRRR